MAEGARRKVFEVVGSLAVGGAERVAVEVAAGLADRGWQTELLVAAARHDAGGTIYEKSIQAEAEKRGVRVHQIAFGGVGDSEGRKRLVRLLRDENVDLLHAHNRPVDWQIVAISRLVSVPAIYTVHLPYTFDNARQRAIYVTAGRTVPKVVCVSKAVARQVESSELVPASKIRVIYNGIRMELFKPATPSDRAAKRAELGWSDSDFGWICAARLHPQKGHSYLLEAMARLPADSRSRLALAGEGPLEAELHALHAKLDLGERVKFLGPRRDVPALLGAADGYACSSMQEGHPLSLLEAMAVELPVVAPRLPPVVEIATAHSPVLFGPDIEGWATSHDPDAMARALLEVERDREGHKERARAARKHVAEAFSREAMLDQHEALYETILARGANRVERAIGALATKLLAG